MSMPSSSRLIKESLEELKQEKWGWVIYRTAYKNNDLAWTRFRHMVTKHIAHIIGGSDTPEIVNNAEWTFMDDRATFNDVSRDFLQQHFKQWAERAVVAENPRAENMGHSRLSSARYCMFVQVDNEALQSVMEGVDDNWNIETGLPGYVNLIDSDWKPMSETSKNFHPELDVTHEEIDGCREENIGWMMVPADLIGPEFYVGVGGSWENFYVRPPEMINW